MGQGAVADKPVETPYSPPACAPAGLAPDSAVSGATAPTPCVPPGVHDAVVKDARPTAPSAPPPAALAMPGFIADPRYVGSMAPQEAWKTIESLFNTFAVEVPENRATLANPDGFGPALKLLWQRFSVMYHDLPDESPEAGGLSKQDVQKRLKVYEAAGFFFYLPQGSRPADLMIDPRSYSEMAIALKYYYLQSPGVYMKSPDEAAVMLARVDEMRALGQKREGDLPPLFAPQELEQLHDSLYNEVHGHVSQFAKSPIYAGLQMTVNNGVGGGMTVGVNLVSTATPRVPDTEGVAFAPQAVVSAELRGDYIPSAIPHSASQLATTGVSVRAQGALWQNRYVALGVFAAGGVGRYAATKTVDHDTDHSQTKHASGGYVEAAAGAFGQALTGAPRGISGIGASIEVAKQTPFIAQKTGPDEPPPLGLLARLGLRFDIAGF